jgi:transcriptional regulator with XRE-family HTH domain
MQTALAILFIEARRRLGISQTEMAKRCGFSGQSRITDIELGKTAFHKDKVPQVAKALNVSEQTVLDAIKATHIHLKGGAPAIPPNAIVIEFTTLEHRRILSLAKQLGLKPEQVPGWLRTKILDWLADIRL